MRAHATTTAVLIAAVAAAMGGGVGRAEDTEVVELNPLTIAGARDTVETADGLHSLTPDVRPGGAGGLPTLASQLAGLPGVVMQESFGGIDPPRLTLRGSGLQSAPVSRGVLWSLDGLPLNATDGSFNSALLEPALVGEIGLVAGASDPLAATTALGGALHLVSPASAAPAHAWLSLGADGFLRAGLSGHCPLLVDNASGNSRHGGIEVWGGASYAAWDGWRPQSAQERVALSGAVGGRFGDGGPSVRVAIFAANPQLDVPGPLTLDAAQHAPDTVSALVAADRPRRETDFARLSVDLTWVHDAEEFTRLAVAGQHTDDWFRQLRANGISDTRGNDFSALLETRRTLGTHDLHLGALARTGTREQARWLNVNGATGPQFADITLDATHAAAWVDDCWTLTPRVALDAGVSFLEATRDAGGSPAGAHGRFDEQAAAPRLGITWEALESLRLSARAARGVEAPTFDDLLATRGTPSALALAWTPLRAQQADTLELGAAGELGALAYSCVAYQATWDNELLRLANASGAPLGTVNASRTKHSGLEAAMRWRIMGDETRALDLTVTHTWSRATFEDDEAYRGRDLAGLPPHAGAAQLTWAGAHGLFGTLGASWIAGTTWADHANRLGYPGYTLANLRVGWSGGRGWSVFVDVDNLFDRAIIASTSGVVDVARNPATTALFLPGLPRQVRFGFSWSR